MNKIKITYEEWAELGQYNYTKKWLRRFCDYRLIKESDTKYKREQRISWPVYLLLFIPVHIVQAFWCMWDGGLKEFEFAERYLGGDWLPSWHEAFNCAEKIWAANNFKNIDKNNS